MATRTRRKIASLKDLPTLIERQDGFDEVLAALRNGDSGTIDGTWGSSCALTAATLSRHAGATVLIALPRLSDVDDFAGDMAGFIGETPLVFPAWETVSVESSAADRVLGARMGVLQALASKRPPRVVVAPFAALLQPVPARSEIDAGTRRVCCGDSLDTDEFLCWLLARGFERTTKVELPGECSMHGGILDLFPADAGDPVRIELFGDEVESIRRFDVETQRKLEELTELAIVIPPGNSADKAGGGVHLTAHLPADSWLVLVELAELAEEGKQYLARLNDPRGFFNVESCLARCTERPSVSLASLAPDSLDTNCHLKIQSIERFSGRGAEALVELASVLGLDERALVVCHNAGEKQRLGELLSETELGRNARVELCEGSLAKGFRIVSERLVVLSDHELFGRTEVRRAPRRRSVETRAIDSFLELNEGELIVHLTHGIGRYRGMQIVNKGDHVEEHLALEFRDGVRVLVPAALIHLVQKYVGGTKGEPILSKLGGTAWERKKRQVADALRDLASDMLRLQAEREAKPGIACATDTHWQMEFEEAFPYTETDDQLRSIEEVKDDMQRARPMDRLICGDVGYGKTEIAMRAAFKAIDNGRQVAVLVPTTVLAEQHFRSFQERMAEYPFTIEVLSRFRTKAEQNRIIKSLRTGGVDLVIGTHRLVQPDIEFKDLGLVVVDEEQRFGVEAKDMLKKLRLEVDVLTLSATPIPRTLHLSLLGIRDISNLQTPPHDRLSIETRICRFDEELIRQGVVRELNRGGQVYFVHNRVYDIQQVADRLQRIVPEARIGIGHGQMAEGELEEVMLAFVGRQLDILVATTIIESGLDIPNANTIFIHEAERYGLADLHQLRGRVGRYKHRAYCYLLLEEGKTLTSTAAKRLKAIEEFSELGAGFKIAMRDLEIRGAGNILGTEQSGHIAAVGYELYCQLLENAVRALKKQPPKEIRHVAIDLPVSGFLPNSYIPPGRQKIDAYRKLSLVSNLSELASVREELRDRYGPVPPEVETLFRVKELQLLAVHWWIDDIHLEEQFAVLGYRSAGRIRTLGQTFTDRPLRVVDTRSAYIPMTDQERSPEGILDTLKSLLQPK